MTFTNAGRGQACVFCGRILSGLSPEHCACGAWVCMHPAWWNPLAKMLHIARIDYRFVRDADGRNYVGRMAETRTVKVLYLPGWLSRTAHRHPH